MRQNSLIILFAFTLLPLLLFLVAYSGSRGVTEPPALALPLGVATASLALAVFLAATRLTPGITVSQFQSQMVICLATSELSSLIGFVLIGRGDLAAFSPCVIGSVAVNLFVIGPRVLAFWRTR